MKNVSCYILIALMAISCVVIPLSSAYFPKYFTMCISITFAGVCVFIVSFAIISVANALARNLVPEAPVVQTRPQVQNSINVVTYEVDGTIGIARAIDDDNQGTIVVVIHP